MRPSEGRAAVAARAPGRTSRVCISPFTTSLSVPSPPRLTTRGRRSPAAAAARSVAWRAPAVVTTSSSPRASRKALTRCERSRRVRPRPAEGFAMTRGRRAAPGSAVFMKERYQTARRASGRRRCAAVDAQLLVDERPTGPKGPVAGRTSPASQSGSNIDGMRRLGLHSPAGGHVTASSTTGTYGSGERRHPSLVRRTAWLRRHSVAVGVAAVVLIAAVFFLDAGVHPVSMAGFYLVPLTLLALSARERLVAAAGVVCGLLTVLVMVEQDTLAASNLFYLLYGGLAGVSLIILAYLIRRLSTISDYATLRAHLSEAGADILTSGGTRDDLDELLQYALERLGEQLDATAGVLLLLEDGYWQGRAGWR